MVKRGPIVFSWLARPYSLIVTISVLFFIIFGAGYYIWQQHYDGDLKNLLSSDKTTANLLSDLLSEHQRATIGILQAYANRPAFIKGVKEKDSKKILPRLIQLKESNKKIDIVFVTDTKGALWVGYPFDNAPLNKNFSYRDWFKGVSKEWKPYVSGIYKRLIGTEELAIATCVPVFDKNGQPIGILANPQGVSFLTTIIRQVPLSDYTKVTLVDQAGHIIYSSKFPYTGEVNSYPYSPLILKAIQEHRGFIEIKDLKEGSGTSYATLAPMKDIGWTVIVERTDRDILRANHGHLAAIAAFSFLFFIFLSLSVFYIRKSFLLSETEKLLEMGKSLREKEERYRTFINSTSDIVFLKDEKLKHIIVNDASLDFFGKKLEDVIGKTDFELQSEGVAESCSQTDRKALESGTIIITEELMGNRTYETRKFPVRLSENKVGVGGYVRDITERKLAEEALKKSEGKYHSIFENAVEGIFQTTPKGQYISVNPAFVRMMGYDSPEELIKVITDLSKQVYVNPEDRLSFKKILEEQGIVQGFETQHYRKDRSKIWISLTARAVKDEAGKVLYYEGTAEDITKRKEAEEDLKQTLEKLRKSLSGTIQAMSLMVETRDPYTAGHQRRVSTLARTIAQEMGLSNDTVDTIRMAGIIHDIGKISVPAEILSRPGKLTDTQFSLIKAHSQTGYDILKDVGLPYPIAEIVLQHHERLDGSGYPQGLKNGQILLESQIISVADVVEAITSFRPYRPGFGIDVALEEIEKNKGILYDAGVVEVCLKLFREKGFSFE
jgi:PAS domain S-box-containing protein/putative nucleotidyltransferase with HDIG domain